MNNKILKNFEKDNFRIVKLTHIFSLAFILIKFQFLKMNNFDFKNKYLFQKRSRGRNN